jgi:hypothetical protein
MSNATLTTIRKRISNVYQRLCIKPDIIKINENWLAAQLNNDISEEDRKDLSLNKFAGIQIKVVHSESYIKDFEFRFKKGTYGGFY